MGRCARLTVSACVIAVAAAPASASARIDFSSQAYNVLAPGETGGVPPDANSTDQARLYDALTPLSGNVSATDLRRYFKSERFGVQGRVKRTEPTGRRGLRIQRDRFNVAHVFGRTRADVMFGSGWVAVEDRGLLMQIGRGPARVAALDVPGINAFGLVTSLQTFIPTAAADRFVARQASVLTRTRKGRQVLADVDAWLAGINTYQRKNIPAASRPKPWTRVDAFAGFAFIGSIFGNGGGDEVRNGQLLGSLQARLGSAAGRSVFRDLREVNDPEAPTTIGTRFPYEGVPTGATPGSAVVDPGSTSASARAAEQAAQASQRRASNFLLVGAGRSATGRPLAVMGPQLGYFYPEIFDELDLHGGGIDVRGGSPPVSPYVLIGRGKDFAWSLTSASNDNTDQFLEQLCNADGSAPTRASDHYVYKGRCRAMTTFDAGLLKGSAGNPDRELVFKETVHGPVSGTVTVGGRPYAVSKMRSTRGREPAGLLAMADLNANKVKSPQDFFSVVNQFETTFNWPYLDSRNAAYFSSGRLPVRAPGTDPSLPTLGTGRYDWRGFLTRDQHPHGTISRNGLLLNWNGKPAPGWGAADNNWDLGSLQRVEMYRGFKRRNRLQDVASVMNRAATQDLRALEVWPLIRRVLNTGPAPDARTAQAASLVDAWRSRGASRLDRDLDGKIDDPGAAVIDAAFPGLALAVLDPVLGPLAEPGGLYAVMHRPDNSPSSSGSSFGGGWYEYMDKDLRTLLGDRVQGRFSRRYCGNGNRDACRDAFWAALKAAADGLAATQGPDPTQWRSDATRERIKFIPGLIPNTMRWTNRSTFQQAIEFGAHR
jgi:acyl-homoserine lactone acylase PvdQ